MPKIRKTNKLSSDQIREIIIDAAQRYKAYFVDYRYLIISEKFAESKYYIIESSPKNFAHLTGLGTKLSPEEFFNKCLDKTITESDFYVDTNDSRRERAVYSKMKCIKNISNIFVCSSYVQENFTKGNFIDCKLATSDGSLTIGFTRTKILHPMTLLDGFLIKNNSIHNIDVVLRGPYIKDKIVFDTLVDGDKKVVIKHLSLIKQYLNKNLRALLK